MKRYLPLLIPICGLCLLNACGGSSGGGSTSGPATHFSVSAPSSVTSRSSFALSVTALDAHNNLAAHYAGTVHFTSTDAQATLPSDSTYDAVAVMFPVTLNTTGNQTITVTDTMQSKIVGVTTPISVLAPTAAKFLLSTPFSATAGTSFTFTVTAVDSTGATFTGYAGTVTFTSSDPQAQLPANSTLTNGKGTFSGTLKTDGNQTITATDSAAASITGTSTSIHVLAPASGFTPTGSMQAREDHTATLLKDGRVLVVGGMHWAAVNPCFYGTRCFQLHAIASAEIFDPATGAFTPTGEISVARVFHTATLLGDGRVLVTGGDDRYTNKYDTAEIFDPSTGAFTLTGNMLYARSGHTATLLNDGKVLLAGGDSTTGSTSTAELFDPATAQFTPTGTMTVSRFFHTATLLTDGRVLLAGGQTGGPTATAELYDPLTGTFKATGNMTVNRIAHRATLLKSGAVLLTGGGSPVAITATAELFDPATGTFAPTGSMTTARQSHTATILPNSKVLVIGGIDKNGTVANTHYLATAEMYDPASGTFTAAGNMEIERSDHAAILLLNGEVLITGGIDADNAEYLNSLGSAELFP
jgi:Galactose oxidase, central domain